MEESLLRVACVNTHEFREHASQIVITFSRATSAGRTDPYGAAQAWGAEGHPLWRSSSRRSARGVAAINQYNINAGWLEQRPTVAGGDLHV
jgi:hypothetical protein